MTKKEWKFTLDNQEVELQLIKKEGTCWNCRQYKEIRLLSERKIDLDNWEIRKFCWACAITNLYQLAESDYEVANKNEIIRELRNQLNNHE